MKCAKCGLELLQGTKQCPKCGLVNEFEQAPPAAKKKPNPLLYAIIALAAVGVLALVFFLIAGGKNVTSAPGGVQREDSNITTAPPGAPGPSGIVTAPPGKPAPTDKTPPGVTKPKPPQEVVDYLAYVKKVEEHRQMLLKDTASALVLAVGGQAKSYEVILDDIDKEGTGQVSDPLANMKKEVGRQYSNWRATLQYLDKKPAPPECREFSGSYRAVLVTETQTMRRVIEVTNKIDVTKTDSILEGVTAMLGVKNEPGLQSDIDKAADNADAKLTSLVSNYDMQKPFDVPRETQKGNILGF